MDNETPGMLGELKDVINEGADTFVRKPLGKVFDGMGSLLGQKNEKGDDVG